MKSTHGSAQTFEDRLQSYSKSSKAAVKKFFTMGSGAGCCATTVAALAVGTTEAEAAVTITNVNAVLNPTAGNFGIFVLDIAGFGIAEDFEFQAQLTTDSSFDTFRMGDRANTLVVGRVIGGYNYPFLLNAGDSISAAQTFLPGNTVVDSYLAFNSGGIPVGDWAGGATGFVGFQITTGADVNYGWIEIRVDADNAGGEIIRYGIESEPGVAAVVPEMNSLAYLAVGAAGLLSWRQRRAEAA
jgi:hypothetical protein